MKKIWKKISILFVPCAFLVIGVATLSHYGINWDEPIHFAKGHAALHYMLTGNKDYLDLPAYSPKPKGASDFMDQFGIEGKIYLEAKKSREDSSSKVRRSYYQSDVWTFDYINSRKEQAHPEVNDLLAAFSNLIFYQKLGIMGDIEAYHLFEVFSAFLIVLGVSIFVYLKLGPFSSMVTAISLSIYPLFFSESHFNIKDPPLAAFYGLTIITFYLGITEKSGKLIFLSSLFAGLAVGTKFNGFFAFPVIFVWLIFYLVNNRPKKFSFRKTVSNNKKILYVFLLSSLFSAFLIYLLSPVLWQNTFTKIQTMVQYYRAIGLGTPPELSGYLVEGFDTYPVLWFVYTTQIPLLALFAVGFLFSFYKTLKDRDDFYFLILIWFLVPFIRVILPNTNIYGGIRQIMEFVPAFAVLCGIGVFVLTKRTRMFAKTIVIAFLVFSSWEIVKIHPNENVYFNQLIGGLSGAREKGIPYWGNTYGNVYFQGVEWMNKNADKDAKFGLVVGSTINIPRIRLRGDIDVSNSYLSGPLRQGEYEMELYFDWPSTSWYRYKYYNDFLEPVYQVVVDGVPLLKIWKNSPEYLREGYDKESLYLPKSVSVEMLEVASGVLHKRITVDLGHEVYVTKLALQHSSKDCDKQLTGYGYVALSTDEKEWVREPEDITIAQARLPENQYDNDTFTFLFAAKKARYILVDTQMENSCYLKYPSAQVRGLSNLP